MSTLADDIHQMEAELAGRPLIPADVMQTIVKEEIERAWRISKKHRGAPKSSKMHAYKRTLKRLLSLS